MAMYHGESGKNWPDVYRELKEYHDSSYFAIDKAMKLEEEGKILEALPAYKNGLELINKAISVEVDCPSSADETWSKACVMLEKMKKTRKEIIQHIAEMEVHQPAHPEAPPSYDEAVSSPISDKILTYQELGEALQNLKVETGATSGELLLAIDNVRVYFISPNGTVTSGIESDTLHIARFEDDNKVSRSYLQVGDWVYPLVPGVSPCFRSENGAIILPDLQSLEEGAAVGIVLPSDADTSVLDLLRDILQGIYYQAPPPVTLRSAIRKRSALSSRISTGIVSGAQYISSGLIWGAGKVSDLMNNGTPRLINHLTPVPQPEPVSPGVKKGVEIAKNVTGRTVQVTGCIASSIGRATAALGRYLAPHVQRQGTRLLTNTMDLSEKEASDRVNGVLEVAAGTVQGLGTIYEGLEQSATILGHSLANNTVKIVQHKYGNPAGEVAGDTLTTVGNMFIAGRNMRHFTPKGLVKDTAKGAGKGLVEEYKQSKTSSEVD